ncbi:hypothetical protein ACKLNR_014472 [Fusarium oxysporum f. sp. zingiberi]
MPASPSGDKPANKRKNVTTEDWLELNESRGNLASNTVPKRQRRPDPDIANEVEKKWKPPSGSWEDEIEKIANCEEDEEGALIVFVLWKNGKKTKHDREMISQRCPQQLLRYYEYVIFSDSVITEDMISRFVNYKVHKKNSTVSIEVLWKNGSITFEDEDHLHAQVPDLLFKYWDGLGGRDGTTGLREYHVFKILGHRFQSANTKLRKSYKVEWVGFPPTQATWEPAYMIKKIAPLAIETYESN